MALIQLRLPTELKNKFSQKAEQMDKTTSDLIRKLMNDFLESQLDIKQQQEDIKRIEGELRQKKEKLKKSEEYLEDNKEVIRLREVELYKKAVFREMHNMSGKTKLKFINLKIKENRYLEFTEELVEIKKRIENEQRRY